MGFFDDAARHPLPRPRGTPWDPPRNEFPRIAASALLLARTEAVAVTEAQLILDAARQSVQIWPPGGG